MSSGDPTGYEQALATIPENQLSTRQQKIGFALGMIRDGASIKKASESSGIPYSTLYRYAKAVSEVKSEEGDGMTVSLEALRRESLVASRVATQRVLERLVDPEHEWKDGDLIKAQGVNIDKVIALSGNDSGQSSNSFGGILEALANQGITLQSQQDEPQTIEAEVVTEPE